MSKVNQISPEHHVKSLFKEFTKPSRILQSFTNLSNTVIETALNGQNKFLFEILQNADDSYEDERKGITIQFILEQNYLIVRHNGKAFDYYDVERICDYASQIEEVKATDLSKTGYKGLGFKSLFNVSDCIYIHSDKYSFRFDKTYWSDSSNRPWQVIPIWCESKDLPLRGKYQYNQPVNIILKIIDVDKFKIHLIDLVKQPELLLYLNHIDKIHIRFDGKNDFLSRNVENFGSFYKVNICNNESIVSTWLMRTYKQSVPKKVQDCIQGASRFIYPNKIQTAKEVSFTFAVLTNQNSEKILKIKGLFYNTLPTQLSLMLPYHINSFFILNLDRTQLHENEWNEFLMNQIGQLQLHLLRDLAELPLLKHYVIILFVSKIDHSFAAFRDAFLKGLNEVKKDISWLPAYKDSHLLKITDAWIDETKFFKQDFQNIQDKVIQNIIDYDVKGQSALAFEVKRFTYDQLFINFHKYYCQLDQSSYINFINYLYKNLQCKSDIMNKLKDVCFLKGKKNNILLPPNRAILEESESPIPTFLVLEVIDNEYLPSNNVTVIKEWLVTLGAKWLKEPADVIRESILKWIDSKELEVEMNMSNHIEILNYLAENFTQLTNEETKKLKEKLLILTESKQFKLVNSCYFPNVGTSIDLPDIISSYDKISSCYDINSLKTFLVHLGVRNTISPMEVLSKIIEWTRNDKIKHKLTENNYISIIEYISQHYTSLKKNNIEAFKKLPLLTCDKSFQKAQNCYFDSVLPKGLKCAIEKNKLADTKGFSSNARKFLKTIGVSDKLSPQEILKRSVIKWIKGGLTQDKINLDNHIDIFKYISKNWNILKNYNANGLTEDEVKTLKKIPILTKNDKFTTAENCYLVSSDTESGHEEIPGLNSIISPDEFVSLNIYSKDMWWFLEELGIKKIRFIDIYEKYSDNLTCDKNVRWFFHELIKYWGNQKSLSNLNNDKLLSYLQKKFQSKPCLLAKDGKIHRSNDLYSSHFDFLRNINRDFILLLDYGVNFKKHTIPKNLEKVLGFKTELELTCISQLLEAVGEKPDLGKENVLLFFNILLEQLKKKDKNAVQMHNLSLLSQDNKLILAKDLYYFENEDDVCFLNSCYLKRIHGMSHAATLELAQLTGVNILQFNQKMNFGQKELICDDSLKEFYLTRLPFFVFQESKVLCESSRALLKELYDKICSIELFICSEISIEYSFGSCTIPNHFENLIMYVKGKWDGRIRSTIFDHVNKVLGFKTDVRKFLDMPINSEEIENWLVDENENRERLQSIVKDFQELYSVKISALNFFHDEKIDDEGRHNENINQYGHHRGTIGQQGQPEEIIDQSYQDEIHLPFFKYIGRSTSKSLKKKRRSRKIRSGLRKLANYHASTSLSTESFENRSFEDDSYETDSSENYEKENGIKWLSEKFVFNFLQDHYKTKYPKSESSTSNGIFEMRWQPSHKLKLTWLNESEEQGHQYDFLLEKDGKIKQLIEVESNYMTDDDSFNLNPREFVKRMNRIALEQPDHIEKFCIYCVFNIQDASNYASAKINPSALYRMGPLKSA